jgi:hypothetical protein
MADELSEKILINCSQTLAGLKTGSIFNISDMSVEVLEKQISELNGKLNGLGVFIERIRSKKNNSLIYVYRKTQLERDLLKPEAANILREFGYPDSAISSDTAITEKVKHLMNRLSDYDCFPHEIGLFLGFPVKDVEEFIRHEGRDCLACGFWKVYCDKKKAMNTFHRYRICARIYETAAAQKRPIEEMTVAA